MLEIQILPSQTLFTFLKKKNNWLLLYMIKVGSEILKSFLMQSCRNAENRNMIKVSNSNKIFLALNLHLFFLNECREVTERISSGKSLQILGTS